MCMSSKQSHRSRISTYDELRGGISCFLFHIAFSCFVFVEVSCITHNMRLPTTLHHWPTVLCVMDRTLPPAKEEMALNTWSPAVVMLTVDQHCHRVGGSGLYFAFAFSFAFAWHGMA
ncbi:hypothetical protein EV426DRAFT_604775 [Tirmania nivea]|nr:hypothetical protein EV426DRAFT_604775 [Tirmania nivea]